MRAEKDTQQCENIYWDSRGMQISAYTGGLSTYTRNRNRSCAALQVTVDTHPLKAVISNIRNVSELAYSAPTD